MIVIQCQETAEDCEEYISYQSRLARSAYELSKELIVLADIGNLTNEKEIQRLLTETKAAGIVSEEAVESLAVQKEMSKVLREIMNVQ